MLMHERSVFLSLDLAYVMVGLAIAMPVGLGGITIDIMLIFALSMGLASIFNNANNTNPNVAYWSRILTVFLGYDSIKNADRGITLSGEKVTKSFFSSYRNGFLVAVSPGNLVFWVNVFGVVLAKSYA